MLLESDFIIKPEPSEPSLNAFSFRTMTQTTYNYDADNRTMTQTTEL